VNPEITRSQAAWLHCLRWGPLLIWMGVISGLSTDAFSAAETSRFILPILRWLLPYASPETLNSLHAVIRKAAHVTEFAVLSFLWYRALEWSRTKWRAASALWAFLLAGAFGALDEAHQLVVPSRTASIVDVGWDSLGALFGVLARHAMRW